MDTPDVITDGRLWAIEPAEHAAIMRAVGGAPYADQVGPDAPPAAAVMRPGATGGRDVAVIPVQGVIRHRPGWLASLFGMDRGTTVGIRRMLREAVADPSVGAIVLDVDSPGGVVSDVPELADEIRAARDSKPVVASVNTRAGSAAAWLATQASEVVVAPSGAIGSIGVYVAHVDWSGWNDNQGLKFTYVHAGERKVDGNPDEPLSDRARATIQADVDAYHRMFVNAVAAGRGVDEATVTSRFGNGDMLLADAAVDAGLADAVGTIDDAVARAFDLATSGTGGPTVADNHSPPAVRWEVPADAAAVSPGVRAALRRLTISDREDAA